MNDELYPILYRRNNKGQPYQWSCKPTINNNIEIKYGIVNKEISIDIVGTKLKSGNIAECKTRYKSKLKEGYIPFNEIKDDYFLPVEGEFNLYNYLDKYLPNDRTTSDGTLLPMLAKTYNNVIKESRIGQWKINGLRCFIGAKRSNDIFNTINLTFQSREGIYWNLPYLEEYLIYTLPIYILNKLCDEDWYLDGEIYLPGYTVNQINSFVKNQALPEHKLLQFWNYDLAIQDTIQTNRFEIQRMYLDRHCKHFHTKEGHLNNKDKLIVLPLFSINTNDNAIEFRNNSILLGFEGAILRDSSKEYQYGKRNSTMFKFKSNTDGIFEIIEINKEQNRNIPIFTCKNDINEECFDCKINGTFDYQNNILNNKHKYIGKHLYIEFGERSGIKKVPFHLTKVKLYDKL